MRPTTTATSTTTNVKVCGDEEKAKKSHKFCEVKHCRQIFRINLTELLQENEEKNLMQCLTLHLQQLTSVSPQNQTLIFGKKKFNFNDTLSLEEINGKKILLLGEMQRIANSSSETPNQYKTNSEDNSEQNTILSSTSKSRKITKHDVEDFVGLPNFQNTCFMNSVLQSLKNCPGFRKIIRISPNFDLQINGKLIEKLRSLINEMCYNPGDTVTIFAASLVTFIRTKLNVFNDKNSMGLYMQQDAQDFLIYVLNHIEEVYSTLTPNTPNLLRNSFQFVLETQTKNLDDQSEEILKGEEKNYVLNLHINSDTKHIHSCLRNAMVEKLQKLSSISNKECSYERSLAFKRLPKYLCLTLTRFYFKEELNVGTKILKSIEFPLQIDLFEFCCKSLKEKMLRIREEMKSAESKQIDFQTTEYKLFDDSLRPEDELSSGSAIYEIKSIITHQGRSSDTGHYISWLKPPICDIGPGVSPFWFKMDDSNVTKVEPEEILNLKGGADTHIAYTFILGPKEIPLPIRD